MKLLIAMVIMVITIHLTVAYEDEWQKHIVSGEISFFIKHIDILILKLNNRPNTAKS